MTSVNLTLEQAKALAHILGTLERALDQLSLTVVERTSLASVIERHKTLLVQANKEHSRVLEREAKLRELKAQRKSVRWMHCISAAASIG